MAQTYSLEKAADKVSLWLDSLHSAKTRQFYLYFLTYVLGKEYEGIFFYELDKKRIDITPVVNLIATAWADPEAIETKLLRWITTKTKEKKLKASAIRTYFAPVNSVLKFCNCKVEIYSILKALPQKNRTSDSAPTKDEIRKLYSICDIRGKFIASAMTSGGFRVGAWDYFRFEDLKDLGDIGQLTIYANEPEQYTTFISTEAMNDFRNYLDLRRKAGEDFSKGVHPILRNSYNLGNPTAQIIRKASSHSVEQFYCDYWRRTGIDRKFSRCHGTRKYFKGHLESTEMKSNIIEKLMGHRVSLEESYHKITPESLADIYRKNQAVLFIDPKYDLEKEMERKEVIHESESNKWYTIARRNEDELKNQKELTRLALLYSLERDPIKQDELRKKIEPYL